MATIEVLSASSSSSADGAGGGVSRSDGPGAGGLSSRTQAVVRDSNAASVVDSKAHFEGLVSGRKMRSTLGGEGGEGRGGNEGVLEDRVARHLCIEII